MCGVAELMNHHVTREKRGEPALKLTIRDSGELDEVIDYIRAMLSSSALPQVRARTEIKRPQPCIINPKMEPALAQEFCPSEDP
jgi:hypothetical protein